MFYNSRSVCQELHFTKIFMSPRKPTSNVSAKASPASLATLATRAKDRARTPTLAVEDAIGRAAADLLAEDGPDALSIRRIAAKAGVAPMTVYNRFGSKQGVVDALFVRGFQQLEKVMNSFGETGSIEEDMVLAAHSYRRFAISNPTLYALMFSRAVPDYVPSEEAGLTASHTFMGLVNAVTPWVENGEIEDGDPIEIAQRIWESQHGAVMLELHGIGFVEDHDAHMANCARMIARGLIAAKPIKKPTRVVRVKAPNTPIQRK
jgi:AcrR family transcriptional regulator